MQTDWPPPPQHIHRTDDLNGIHLVLKTPASFIGMRPLSGLLIVLGTLFLMLFFILAVFSAPRFDIEAALGMVICNMTLLLWVSRLFRKRQSHDAALTVTDRAVSVTYREKTQQVLLSEVVAINARGELKLRSGGQVQLAPRQSQENRRWVSIALGQWLSQHSAQQGARSDIPEALRGLKTRT